MHTWALVVADGEVLGDGATNVRKTLLGAVLGGAADGGGALPDDLGEVTPLVEVVHAGLGLAVKILKVVDLAVVKEVGDDGGDVVCFDASSNVLAVSAAVRGPVILSASPSNTKCQGYVHVMGVDTARGDSRSSGGKISVPRKVGCRVVGAVDVVVIDDSLRVVIRRVHGAVARCWGSSGRRRRRSARRRWGVRRSLGGRGRRNVDGGGDGGGRRLHRSDVGRGRSLAGRRRNVSRGRGTGGPDFAPGVVAVVIPGRVDRGRGGGGGCRSGLVASGHGHVGGLVHDIDVGDDGTLAIEGHGDGAGGERSSSESVAHFDGFVDCVGWSSVEDSVGLN